MTPSNEFTSLGIRNEIVINTVGVDLAALQSRSLCIIGPSGVGKSTLAGILEERTNYTWRIPPSVVTEPRSRRCNDFCICRPISIDRFNSIQSKGAFFLHQISPVGNVGIEIESVKDFLIRNIGLIFILRTHGGIKRFLPDIPIIELRAPLSVLENRIHVRSKWRPLLTSLPILMDVCTQDLDDNEMERALQSSQGVGRWIVLDNGVDEAPIPKRITERVMEALCIKGEEG